MGSHKNPPGWQWELQGQLYTRYKFAACQVILLFSSCSVDAHSIPIYSPHVSVSCHSSKINNGKLYQSILSDTTHFFYVLNISSLAKLITDNCLSFSEKVLVSNYSAIIRQKKVFTVNFSSTSQSNCAQGIASIIKNRGDIFKILCLLC